MGTLNWYVIHSHPQREELLFRQICFHGFECLLPELSVKPVNPRSRNKRPYFPGYLFVRIDLALVGDSLFRWMPYSYGLVVFGGEPAVLSDSIVISIKKRLESVNLTGQDKTNSMKMGDEVEIDSGLLSGYEAIFDTALSGQQRVRVLLKILGQSRKVEVELPVSDVKPKARQGNFKN
jgi:transcriptional antiterminator RfaH